MQIDRNRHVSLRPNPGHPTGGSITVGTVGAFDGTVVT
jgi:hypothetical protein